MADSTTPDQDDAVARRRSQSPARDRRDEREKGYGTSAPGETPHNGADSSSPHDSPLMVRKLIGERIRDRRRELRMEQAELAVRIGASQATMSKYESGSVSMRMEELPKLARALGVSVAYFFMSDSEMKSGGIDWREIEDGLIADFRRLPAWMRISIAQEMHGRAIGADAMRERSADVGRADAEGSGLLSESEENSG